MTKVFLMLTFLSMNLAAFAQVFNGKAVDRVTGEPLGYVTITVPGKNIGGIGVGNGDFSINLAGAENNDEVKVSYLGYDTYTMPFSSVNFELKYTIALQPKSYDLKTIDVPVSATTMLLGNQKTGRNYTGWGDFESKKGRSRGLRIEGAECPVKVKSLSFRINHNDWDSVAFRLNFLNEASGKVNESVLQENIIITTALRHKWVKVDLSKHNIIICDKTIVVLEWVDAWGKTGEQSNLLTLSLSKNTGLLYIKEPGEESGTLQATPHAPAMVVEVYN